MSNSDSNVLVEDILVLADRLFRALLPSVPDELMALDVTMPQMKIMLLLYVRGSVRMSNIANDLKVTLPTATSLIEKLVDKNYVLRDTQSDDRRVVLCKLSVSGKKTITGIWISARKRSQQLLLSLDYSKLEMFRDVLNAMMQSSDTQQSQKSNDAHSGVLAVE
jgi:DNA-binding MarR family transcriptional regulator